MELKEARCTNCGAHLNLEPQKTMATCDYCHSTIMVSNAVELALVEVDKTKDLERYRTLLKDAIQKNSIGEILTQARQIKDIIPSDFTANYYFAYAKQSGNEPSFMKAFLNSTLPATPEEINDVVNHIIHRSDLRDKPVIMSFLTRISPESVTRYEEAHKNRARQENQYANVKRDIFICHSSHDRVVAEKIVESLEKEGFTCWISTRNLRPEDSENYWENIRKAIKNTQLLLVVSSESAMLSKDVQREIEISQERKQKRFEYKIDDTPQTVLFKHTFDGIKWVDGSESPLNNVKKLPTRVYEELQGTKKKTKSIKVPRVSLAHSSRIKKLILPVILIVALLGVSGIVFGISGILTPAEYTVQFTDYDNEVIETLVLEEESQIVYPTPPSREGYTFSQWSESPEFIEEDLTIRAEYEVTSYEILFQDFDGSIIERVNVAHGSDVNLPDDPVRVGYEFTGWEGNTEQIKEDTTLTATYLVPSFNVIFNDHTGSLLKHEVVEYGQDATPPVFEREGYDLIGWSKSTDNITDDLLVNPIFEVKKLTVVFFDYDRTIISSQIVEYGDSATEPPAPSRDGYIFEGWSESTNDVTEDRNIIASYSQNTLVVNYYDLEGSLHATFNVNYGDNAPIPVTPSEPGYVFKGWTHSNLYITKPTNIYPLFENMENVDAPTDRKVIVHYHRWDGDYEGRNVWTWNTGTNGSQAPVPLEGTDEFGGYFEIYIDDDAGDAIGLILRYGDAWGNGRNDRDGLVSDEIDDKANKEIIVKEDGEFIGFDENGVKHVFVYEGMNEVIYEDEVHGPMRDGYGTLAIVYYDPAENPDEWSIWTWNNGIGSSDSSVSGRSVPFVASLDVDGGTIGEEKFRIAFISIGSDAEDEIGFVVRDADWNKQYDEDLFVDVRDIKGEGYNTVFYIGESSAFYDNFDDFYDVSSRNFTESETNIENSISIKEILLTNPINDEIDVNGVVSSLFDGGFFIYDGEEQLSVYIGSGGTGGGLVDLGDEVRVTGTLGRYYTVHQLSDIKNVEVVSSGNAIDIEVTPITIEGWNALDLADPLIHGDFYEVTGTLVQQGEFNNLFLTSSESDDEILVYYYSDADSLEALEEFIGRTITLELVYYTNHASNGIMASYYGDGTDVVEAGTYKQKLTLDVEVLEGMSFVTYGDAVKLPATGSNGTTFSNWASGDADLVGDDGSYGTTPATPTDITFTATATLGDETSEVEITVQSLAEISIEDALEVDPGGFIWFSGKVVDIIDGNSGLFLYDETGIIYVRDTDFYNENSEAVEIGDSWTFVGARTDYRGLPQVASIDFYEASDETFADEPDPTYATVQDIVEGNVVPGQKYLVYGTATTVEEQYTNYELQDGDFAIQLHFQTNNSAIEDFDGQEVILEVRPFQWDNDPSYVAYFGTNREVLSYVESLRVIYVPSRPPDEILEITEPLADLLIDDLADQGFGVGDVKISVSSTYDAAGEALIAGTGDIAFLPGETYVSYKDIPGSPIEVLLAATRGGYTKDSENAADWNDGEATDFDPDYQVAYYKGLIIAGPSPAGQALSQKVNDGAPLAWDDVKDLNWCVRSATSSSGYIYPNVWLNETFGYTFDAIEGSVTATGGYGESAARIATGTCDVATFYADARRYYADRWTNEYGRSESIWAETNVVGVTDNIMNDTISASTVNLDDDLMAAIKQAFLNIAQTLAGQDVMSIYSHQGYTEVLDSDYDAARKAVEIKGD